MRKRKVKKSVIRFILRIVSVFIIVSFFVISFPIIVKLKNLSNEEKELSKTLIELKKDEEKLKTDILKLNDKEYIARYAREHYLYTKDGEIALKIDENEEEDVSLNNNLDNNYSYIYIGLTGAFVILVIVFVNHRRKKK